MAKDGINTSLPATSKVAVQEENQAGMEELNDSSNETALMQKFITNASTLQLTDKEKEILYAPPPEEMIEIRADGLIYLPWVEYAKRLREAFNGAWTLVPKGLPKVMGNFICWGFYLVIKGVIVGFAFGEQEYHPNNPKMSWTDACEAAKSNALMRLCKGIGVALELWEPTFIQRWKTKYAIATRVGGKIIYKKRQSVAVEQEGDDSNAETDTQMEMLTVEFVKEETDKITNLLDLTDWYKNNRQQIESSDDKESIIAFLSKKKADLLQEG